MKKTITKESLVFVSIFLFFAQGTGLAYRQSRPTSPGSPQTTTTAPEGRTASPQETPLRLGVTLVQMDVVVVDQKGRQVSNLKPEDLEILEDGRPQRISNFSYICLDYGFIVYNATIDPKTGHPQLDAQVSLFRDGRPVYSGKPAPLATGGQTDPRAIQTGGRIALGQGIEPGDYTLEIAVSDRLAQAKRRTASRWIDFEVVK